MLKQYVFALLAAVGLAGCTATTKTIAAVVPEKIVTSDARLACVSSALTPSDRQVNYTVLEFPDKTGKINTNGGPDATGAFNTQGAEYMLLTTLGRTGVNVVHTSAAFRSLAEWQAAKFKEGERANAVLPSIAITGAISSTDFPQGGGTSVEVAGIGGGTYRNRVLQSIDMVAVTLPTQKGGPNSGKQVAQVTVTATLEQSGVEVKVAAFDLISSLTKQYVAIEAGHYTRAPMQYWTRVMLEFGLAEVLSQIYGIKGCTPAGTPTPSLIAAAH